MSSTNNDQSQCDRKVLQSISVNLLNLLACNQVMKVVKEDANLFFIILFPVAVVCIYSR